MRLIDPRHLGLRRAGTLLAMWVLAACASRGAPVSRPATAALAGGTDTIAPGLIHQRYVGVEPAIQAHVVTVDLQRRDLHVESASTGPGSTGRERTSAIARRHTRPGHSVLVAINADFFDLETGEVENNQVAAGAIVRATSLTDSQHDVFDNIHTQFALTTDRRPLIERFRFDGEVLLDAGESMRIDAVDATTDSAAVVLYITTHSTSTPPVVHGAARLRLDFLASRGDTAVYVVAARAGGEADTTTRTRGAVLAANGDAAVELRRTAAPGDTLRILLGFQPDHGPIRTLVGGWPRIVRHGASVSAQADSVEGTFPDFSKKRHPRTAVGFSRDSTRLYLVTVDGRQDSSVGMTLDELAQFMIEIGAFEALNLDGGGSTTLVIRGGIVNSPSDSEGERPVGNAILVHRRGGDEP